MSPQTDNAAGAPGSDAALHLQHATVLTMDEESTVLRDVTIVVRDGVIVSVGPDAEPAPGDEVLDLSNRIVFPGFQDTHRHAWEGALRQLIPDCDIDTYLQVILVKLAPAFTADDVRLGNLLTSLSCLDAGTTTIMDFSHNAQSTEYVDGALDGLRQAGIRVAHAMSSPFRGTHTLDLEAELARVSAQLAADPHSLITLRLARYTDVKQDELDLARGLGIGLSVDGVKPASTESLVTLGAAGELGPDITLIHCNGLPEAAWDAVAAGGACVSLALGSDGQYGIGSALSPMQYALDRGIRPSLSVDVEISFPPDMFTQLRTALLSQRMLAFNRRYEGEADWPTPIGAMDVLRMATVNGAIANGLHDRVGRVVPGLRADLVAIRTDDINTMPMNSEVGTVVCAANSANVDLVLVDGVVRKRDGKLVGVDLEELAEAVARSRDGILQRAGYAA